MTREDIQLELSVCTLRPQDASDEVRAALQADADLDQRHQKECAFDAALCRLLGGEDPSAAVPEGAKERLKAALAEESIQAPTTPQPAATSFRGFRTASSWLAAAAAIAIGLFAVKPWETGAPTSPWQDDAIALLDRIESGSTSLDAFSNDLAVLKTSLSDSGTPMPQDSALPKRFGDIPLLGCKSCVVDGCSASVICFRLGPDNEAHVVVLNETQPGVDGTAEAPAMDQMGDWNVAQWIQDGKTYFLATRAPAKELQKLFAVLFLARERLAWI